MARAVMPLLYEENYSNGESAHWSSYRLQGGLMEGDRSTDPLFSYFVFEVPKNRTNTIEATARVVMIMKSVIRLDLYYTRALLSDSALKDRRVITLQWSICRTERSVAAAHCIVIFQKRCCLKKLRSPYQLFTTIRRKVAKTKLLF